MLGAAGNVITSPVNKIAKIAKAGSDNKKMIHLATDAGADAGAYNSSGEAIPSPKLRYK